MVYPPSDSPRYVEIQHDVPPLNKISPVLQQLLQEQPISRTSMRVNSECIIKLECQFASNRITISDTKYLWPHWLFHNISRRQTYFINAGSIRNKMKKKKIPYRCKINVHNGSPPLLN